MTSPQLGNSWRSTLLRICSQPPCPANLIMANDQMLMGGPVLNPNRTQILELAVKSRLPVIYRNREDVEAGRLICYGVNLPDLDRRAAVYVDKILKGAKPADLPVEQPTKFEFIINLKAAKQIGLT